MTPGTRAFNLVRAKYPEAKVTFGQDYTWIEVDGNPLGQFPGEDASGAWINALERIPPEDLPRLPEPYFCRQPHVCKNLSRCPLDRVCND